MGVREVIFWMVFMVEFGVNLSVPLPEGQAGRVLFRKEAWKTAAAVFLVANFYALNSVGTIVSTAVALTLPFIAGLLFKLFRMEQVRLLSFWIFFSISNGMLIKLLFLMVEGLVTRENIITVNYGERRWAELVLEAGLIVFLLLLRRFLYRRKINLLRLCQRYWPALLSIGLLEHEMTGIIMVNSFQEVSVLGVLLTLFTLFTAMAAMCAVFVFSIYQQMKAEQSLLEVRQKMMAQFYTELREKQEQSERLLHDWKHERTFIYQKLQAHQAEAVLQYLEEKEKYRIPAGQIWTGCGFMDFIINRKKEEIDQQDIRFTLDSEFEQLPIPEADFSILLGNLLDNAVEAAGLCESGRRWITLAVKDRSACFLLTLSNSSSRRPVNKHGRFVSTKKDSRGHGWGLENVAAIIQKYDAEIKYNYTDQLFEVRAAFWQKQEKKEGERDDSGKQ